MSTSTMLDRGAAVRADLGRFLNDNLNRLRTAWPRRPQPIQKRSRIKKTSPDQLRVLVAGDLAVEMVMEVDARRKEVLSEVEQPGGASRVDGHFVRVEVGGFAGRVIPALSRLGVETMLCATLPVQLPNLIERFLGEHHVDRRYTCAMPELPQRRIRFRCRDGTVTVLAGCPRACEGASVPLAATQETNVVLFDSGAASAAPSSTNDGFRWLHNVNGRHVVGVAASNTTSSVQRLASACRDTRAWLFVPRKRPNESGLSASPWPPVMPLELRSAIAPFKRRYGHTKLVLREGDRGAVLYNGVPTPYHVHACPIDVRDTTGAAETLLAITTLSSALGADDRTSLRRGVEAATGLIAGLPLPSAVEELDAA